nr:hypothetical protein GCM10020092_039860 [Actinoplanes digitatis]
MEVETDMTEGYEQTSTRRAPASAAQGRLWLLSQLEDERSAYNVLLPLRFVGDLDVPALRSALSGLVERHEILRTRYVAQDGEPVQVIEAPAPVELAETDLSTMDEDGQESALDAAFDDAETRPFDLGTGPVLRAALLRLAAHRHVLLLSVHHIAIDAGSTPVLYRDLAAGYRAHLAGTTDGLPPLAFQYADHAVRERAAMTGELTGRAAGVLA